jgi:hypothetical protein
MKYGSLIDTFFDALVRLEFEHPIHQQNRIAMRQQRENLMNVEIDFFGAHGVSAHALTAR